MESVLIKTVPGYKFYSDGRIWSEKKKDFMVGDNGKDGYNRVKINGVRKHRSYWIALAFIPNTDNLPEVNHRDENKLNDRVRNLEWCTSKYNCNYGTRNKRIAEKQNIPVFQYSLDGEKISGYASATEAARILGVAQSAICNCCKGKSKALKGNQWSYVDAERIAPIKPRYERSALSQGTPIRQLDLNRNLIREWATVSEAARALNASSGSICSALRGRYKTAYGCIWEYVTPN